MQTAEDVRRIYQRQAILCRLAPTSQLPMLSGRHRQRFVLSVGALAPHKGFDFLVTAIAAIAEPERPPLVIVSNYQERHELAFLQELARERGVEVSFHCNVSDAALAEWFARAGCFAYTPMREPFGLVVLEAMAAGVPVIAVAEGGMRESIEPGVTGLLCERESTSFGAAILGLLSNTALARRLTERARRVVADEWTWEKHIACVSALLEQASERRTLAV
jgi:glycosyltransferase involved in cell wall biosynthesis